MSKAKHSEQGPDLSRPLKYSADKAVEVALEMLSGPMKGNVPEAVVKVLEDMFMAGAFYSLDISMFGQDYTEGEISTREYSTTTLSEEAHSGSKIVQILEEDDDDDNGGEDEDDDASPGYLTLPKRLH